MRIIKFYEFIPYSVKFEGFITLAFPIMLLSKSAWDAADTPHNRVRSQYQTFIHLHAVKFAMIKTD